MIPNAKEGKMADKKVCDLSGRIDLVTAGGRGLGREFCDAMTECGADVACSYFNALLCCHGRMILSTALWIKVYQNNVNVFLSPIAIISMIGPLAKRWNRELQLHDVKHARQL